MTQSFRHFLRVEIAARCRRLVPRAVAAVRAWAQPDENPFLQKALRIEARKCKPFFTVAVIALLSFLAALIVWWLWTKLQIAIEAAAPGTWPHWRRTRFEHRIVTIFDDNPISWFALTTALVSACGVLWSARARAAYLLRQELIKNTLVQLQQLPIAEERWLWLFSAHPASLGVLIWLCGLPIYLIATATGQWSLLDVLGLLVLFFLLGHTAPAWTPGAWQQKARAGNKVTWQQWQLLQKQVQGAARSGDVAAHLESQRRLQRALAGLEAEYSASSAPPKVGTDDTSRQRGQTAPAERALILIGDNSRGFGNAGGSFSSAGMVGFIFFFIQIAKLIGLGSLQQLTASWPHEASRLLPAYPLTWPLLLARLIWAPLPFFAFALPPILLVVPLWIALSHQRFISLASHVSAAETFWTPPRLQRRQLLFRFSGVGTLLFVFGYGWPVLVTAGELARLVYGAPTTPNWALAAGWTLALVAGAFLGGMAQEAPFRRVANQGQLFVTAWRESTRTIGGAMLFAITAHFTLCWLGGKSGFNAAFLSRLPVTLFTVLAFLLADFGSAAWGATLAPPARRSWNALRLFWFHGLGIAALALLARGALIGKPFSFNDAPFVLLSPFVTLFSLFRVGATTGLIHQPIIGLALLFQIFVGGLCTLLAYRAVFHVLSASGGPASTPDGEAARPGSPWIALLLRIGHLLSAPFQLVAAWLEKGVAAIARWQENLVHWGGKFDNPVLTYELRRRIRKENWLWLWIGFLLAQATLFLTVARPWQLIRNGAATGAFSGAQSYNTFADWGHSLTCTVLILMAFFAVLASLNIGRAFDADRANGTLVFLFLTPQTNREILLGKWLAGIIYTAGVLSTGLGWLLIGVFVATGPGHFPPTALLALCGLVAITALAYFSSTVNLFFASRARKPTEGQGWALLAILGIEIACAAILGFAFSRMAIASLRNVPDEVVLSFVLILTALLHGVLGAAAWQLALRSFARRRYGDIEASGKGAN